MKTGRKLFIISGPSGTGKGTLISRVLKRLDDVVISISATTRKERAGEKPRLDYYFLSEEEFNEKIRKNEFLEWANVHSNRYGTIRDVVRDHLRSGNDVILELDVQGALSVRKKVPNSILVFIKPPSSAELKKRLMKRKTETEEDIELRLKIAKDEIEFANKYDYIIINDDLNRATEELLKIIKQEKREKTTTIL